MDVLIFWAKQGVDGFRCDVAGFVPIDFWKTAKRVLAEVNSNIISLSNI